MSPFNTHRWLDFLKYSDISTSCLGVDWGLMNAQTIKLIDFNLINLYDQRNTLNLAAQFCPDPEVIKYLLDSGVSLTHISAVNYNSLHYAAAYNPNPAVLIALIDAGLDINTCAPEKTTAAHLAVGPFQYNPAVLDAALERGAALNAVDAHGKTALHYACSRRMSHNNPFIETLLARSPQVNIKDHSGLTPFELLIKFHHPMPIIRKFLKHPVEITKQTLALCEQYYDGNLKKFLSNHVTEKA